MAGRDSVHDAIHITDTGIEALSFCNCGGASMGSGRVFNPDWQPLERMLGVSCCESFMFMGCFGEIHLYKNIWTRRYLNLGPDGTCFRYTGSGYVAIRREEAINHVFS